ncbi:hypothetical protein B0T20DRAFT_222521 [Sordaria brevicollis]|uniref:Rhodanese domain-containing protein n=1 Tax=Sordaria brevicollis TaxID=83679 RepID=A0AAE0PCR7_SORBR|nr:hypothetical protein B0T20DRAFT_222521 [Sordaria brevicollis]
MGIHVHEHCLRMARREDGTPWWAAFPEPNSTPAHIDPQAVLELLEGEVQEEEGEEKEEKEQSSSSSKRLKFLLVDCRRTDCTGGTVSSSINLPAHSFYPTRKSLYALCKQAGIQRIIFYCGSSAGRGPRCAAWMQDYIDEVGERDLQSQVMTGGIRGWVRTYGDRMMDGYDEKTWKQLLSEESCT